MAENMGNGLPSAGRLRKSGHRMAAEGMRFPWRWDGGTIFPVWMSSGECRLEWSSGESRFGRAGGDPTLVADDNLHPSGKVYTPWADIIVPLAESALLKEETP